MTAISTSLASVTAADVRHLLEGHDVHPALVEFVHEIGPNGIEFVGFDEHRSLVVRGVVALRAHLVDGKLEARAEVELLRDGEVPF
jgi:hypothetical protein